MPFGDVPYRPPLNTGPPVGFPVSVKWFGAMGDGSTDDTAAIQEALDTATEIYFPAGTYIATALTVTDSVDLSGVGTIKQKDSTNGQNLFAFSGTGKQINIRGITLDGNQANQGATTVNRLIHCANLSNSANDRSYITVSNVTFKNVQAIGFELNPGDTTASPIAILYDCKGLGIREGNGTTFAPRFVAATNSAQIFMRHGYFDSLLSSVDRGASGFVGGRAGGSAALTTFGRMSAHDVNFSRLGYDSATNGLAVVEAHDNINDFDVFHCRFEDCVFQCVNTKADSERIRITHNKINSVTVTYASAAAGIGVNPSLSTASGDFLEIDYNELITAGNTGISVDGNNSDSTDRISIASISHNRLGGHTGTGIDVQNLHDPTIVDNKINAGTTGITFELLYGTATFDLNEVHGPSGAGIASVAAAAMTCDGYFRHNVLDDVGTTALFVDRFERAVIQGNDVGGGSTKGIDVANVTVECIINGGNVVEDSVTTALTIASTVTDPQVHDNVGFGYAATLTIASGVLTIPGGVSGVYLVAGEGGSADSIDSFSGIVAGGEYTLMADSDTIDITVNDGGNVHLGAATRVLDSDSDALKLASRDGTNVSEVAFQSNA